MDTAKIIGIAHRIRVTKATSRQALMRELLEEIDSSPGVGPEGDKPGKPARSYPEPDKEPKPSNALQVESLRAMLQDEGIRDNPNAVASLVKAIRALR